MQKEYREFLYALYPASPNINILYNHSTIIKTNKLTKFCQFRAITNKAAINILAYVYWCLCVPVVPKTILGLNDSLEGLTGLRHAVILVIIVYYSRRIDIKISKEKRSISKVQEKPGTSFQGSSPSGVAWTYLFSQQWCVTIQVKWCQPGNLAQTLVSMVFIGDQWQGTQGIMTDLSYSDSSPQSKIGSHLFQLVWCGPRPQTYKNTLIRENIPRVQSSSPRSQPRASPENRPFFGIFWVLATHASWVNLFLYNLWMHFWAISFILTMAQCSIV